MSPQLDRRRYADVPKPGGERWTDKLAARHRAGGPIVPRVWLWGAMLWFLAAMAGAAYGAGWLQRLVLPLIP